MSEIVIYKNNENEIQVEVTYDQDTFWLSLNQIAQLFDRDKSVISRHIKNIFNEGELTEYSTVAKNATVQLEGKREIKRKIEYYNLNLILAVGYRVSSIKGTQFRIWATKRLNEYLVKGYAINEKRLAQKQQEVEYLKTGIRILGRTIEEKMDDPNKDFLIYFSKGLELLDDYDHESLDNIGLTTKEVIYPNYIDYMRVISEMYSDFKSEVFAKPKDESFKSSINQISFWCKADFFRLQLKINRFIIISI